MRIITLAIFIVATGCYNKVTTDASLVLTNFTEKQNFILTNDTLDYSYRKTNYKVLIDKYSSTNSPRKIFGYLAGNSSFYGSYFKFDKHGKLEGYYFMAGDGEHDLYRVVYNPDIDKYEEQGNACVDYFAPHDIEDTANSFTLIFSTFPRKDIDAFYSTDHVHFKKLPLTELLPFIAEVDVVLTKKEVQQGILVKVNAKNLRTELIGLENGKETIDTLHFKD